MTGYHHRDEYHRHDVSKDKHTVLRHLRIGDAFHATEYRVEEDNCHADDNARHDIHFQKAAKYHANTTHLAGNIGETDKDGTEHGNGSRGL